MAQGHPVPASGARSFFACMPTCLAGISRRPHSVAMPSGWRYVWRPIPQLDAEPLRLLLALGAVALIRLQWAAVDFELARLAPPGTEQLARRAGALVTESCSFSRIDPRFRGSKRIPIPNRRLSM